MSESASFKKIIKYRSFSTGVVLICVSLIFLLVLILWNNYLQQANESRFVGFDFLEELASFGFASGFGLIMVAWFQDDVRKYTDEIITAQLGNRKILEKFSQQSLKEFISTALEQHAPNWARAAISTQLESARKNESSLGRKSAKEYKLVIGDFQPAATTSASGDVASNTLNLNLANYFQCKFIETYDLRLTSKECDKPFSELFTVRKEMLPSFFQKNSCIYRDLLLLSSTDEECLKNFLKSNNGKTLHSSYFGGLLSAHLEISVPGISELQIIKNPTILITDDGIEFQFPLTGLKEHLENGEALKEHLANGEALYQVEVVNKVEFPVWKEVRGYPLIFMSYSQAPRIELIVNTKCIVENSFIPFLSALDSESYRNVTSEANRNPTSRQINVNSDQWVLPFSGVYVTWQLKDLREAEVDSKEPIVPAVVSSK